MYYVYFIKSKIYNKTYIGSTNNLRRRFSEHNNGLETSTRRYKPWRLIYYEAYRSEEDAREREMKLKKHGNAVKELKKRIQRSIKNGAGFTLAEILVSIFIIILLSGIIFANYRTGGQQFALQRSANKLAQDIRRVQQMAISASECEPCGGIIPGTGYGIALDTNWDTRRYRLYADTNGDNEFFTPQDTIIETIDLEKGIIIKQIGTLPDTSPQVSINFKPPDPDTKIKYLPAQPSLNEGILTLALETNLNQTKTVKINKAGLIEIE